jgi:hypothetical protein
MSSGMMEGLIHQTNESHFKTGRRLTEGPLMVQLGQDMRKGTLLTSEIVYR